MQSVRFAMISPKHRVVY